MIIGDKIDQMPVCDFLNGPDFKILTGEKMAEFIELLRTRRSTRDFEDKAVPLALVKEIINESCLASSA